MMFNPTTSLRSKMFLALALGMLLLFGLMFFVVRTSLIQGYAKLEVDKVSIQVSSAVNLLEEQSKQLGASVLDNAHWNGLYQYVASPDQAFIDSSFGDATFTNLKINAYFIVNLKGEVLSHKGVDFTTGKPWRIPDILMQAVSNRGILLDPSKSSINGLFKTPAGICIVSTSDILTSEETGPRRGTLIMVRLLNQALIEHIEKILGTKLSVEAFRHEEISTISSSLFNKKIFVKPINDKQVAGFGLMDEIGGDAEILIQTVGDRKIYEQGLTSLNFLYWSAVVAALLLAAFSWLFDKLVLKKLAHLNKHVLRIGESAATSERIKELNGDDEMASLAKGINLMLEQLDKTKYELQFEKERAQVTLSSIADAVITSDLNGCVVYMNKAAESLTGVVSSQARSKSLQDLFHLMTPDKTTAVNSLWLTNPQSIEDEVMLGRADGQEFIITKSASQLYDANGGLFGTVTVLHDVTVLRMMSNQLTYQAHFDALTGLANRYEFDRKAQAAIEDTRTSSLSHCIAYIDLDKFKLVNDTCGHMIGDVFLKQLANHMQAKLRSADTLARLGGDEFALLLVGCRLDKAQEITRELLESIQAFRFEHDNKVFKVGASIGLTEISPSEMLGLSTLLATADSACYAAKRGGGNNVHVYQANDSSMQK